MSGGQEVRRSGGLTGAARGLPCFSGAESVASVLSAPAELLMMHNPAVVVDLLMTPPCWRSSNYSGLSISPIYMESLVEFSIVSTNDWYSTQNANLGKIANFFCQNIDLWAKVLMDIIKIINNLNQYLKWTVSKVVRCNNCFFTASQC